MIKFILFITILGCINNLMAQKRFSEGFCYHYQKEDTFCIFGVYTTKDYKRAVIYPNIFDELSKNYIFNRISDATGRYRVIIEFCTFKDKVFINDVKIDYCDNSAHKAEINAIIRSCVIKFENEELWEEKRDVLSYTAFNLTPK